MDAEPTPTLPEARRNARLRQVDWRFLLAGRDAPRVALLAPAWDTEALGLISAPAEPGAADLALVGFPSAAALRSAREALAPGGEVVCRWRLPRLNGARRARRRLRRAGFNDVRVYWAGPLPHRTPQFWLPLGSPAATAHLLAGRPVRSLAGAALRSLWRLAAWTGVLAPLFAIARAPGGDTEADHASWLLLSGGHRSINKVVGLAIEEGRRRPSVAVKFARVAEAEPGLGREADVLARLGEERPEIAGVPRLRKRGRRGGRLAIAEDAVEGETMLASLSPANFATRAERVTDLLIELAGRGGNHGKPDWRRRLVDEPLSWFERSFGPATGPDAVAATRRSLAGLGELPAACEHRDCSPWNIVLGRGGAPTLLDWESAEPDGLPGLDLVYFLANCAFVLDGAIESSGTRASYVRLLDPGTAHGRVAAAAIDRYSAAIGIDAEDFRRLRLLCWIVHSRSDYRHLELDVAGKPSAEALRGAMFLGLVEEEVSRGQER